jgi:D-glucosaminate-6-phosphate ammonia-lyase
MPPSDETDLTRRLMLGAAAGGAIGGLLGQGALSSATAGGEQPQERKQKQNVYDLLGVKCIINAAGTMTALGGSLMPPEVVAAWTDASLHFVDLLELQDRIGERIAKRLGVEAALVTTGAAGGMVLGTAAAVTYRDHRLIGRLPLPPEMGMEVIRQKAHRDCYDHQITACGVRLVDVETLDDLERAISRRTAVMMAYNYLESESKISRTQWIETARKHKVPTLLDAAADTPPLDALWKYNKMGYDMVVFSGGKGLRGPQNAGLLLGRKDLIEAAKLNTAPRCWNIGRGMKVSKEDMVAMWAAVERYVSLDHAAQQREWERRIGVIEDALRDLPTVKTKRIVPPIANHVPHVLILWDENRLRITPAQLKKRLLEGDPAIATARVHGTGDEGHGFLISVFMLQEGEDRIVAARLREILRQAAKT